GKFPEQTEILQSNSYASLAFAGVTAPELERDFYRAANPALDQNFQQDFEAFRLQFEAVDALPPHHEESRQRIFDFYPALERCCRKRAAAGNQQAKLVPFANPVPVHVAACNGDV